MKAVLVSIESDISEMIQLMDTLEYDLENVFIQNRSEPDPKFYLGRGKVGEVRANVEVSKPDIIIANDEIKPTQRFNLERELGIEVYDRIRIILEIFHQRARSEEARLQVELAQLRYDLPWLREVIHRATLGEHPGLMAGGEYPVRQLYTQANKRSGEIRKRLRGIEKDREGRRAHRKREGFVTVGVTGYTNAGKSTLFNSLTDEEVLVDDRMFATLSTTVRRMGDKQPKVLLTDTVGFIENLPPWLIEAFNSTIEEVYMSDVLLLVVDSTDNSLEMLRKVETCLDIIWAGEGGQLVLGVLNKVDALEPGEAEQHLEELRSDFSTIPFFPVSAKDGTGLERLIGAITEAQMEITNNQDVSVFLPDDDYSPKLLNWLYENAVVKEKVMGEGGTQVSARVPLAKMKELKRMCGQCGCELKT